jgi:hypothetical protein
VRSVVSEKVKESLRNSVRVANGASEGVGTNEFVCVSVFVTVPERSSEAVIVPCLEAVLVVVGTGRGVTVAVPSLERLSLVGVHAKVIVRDSEAARLGDCERSVDWVTVIVMVPLRDPVPEYDADVLAVS